MIKSLDGLLNIEITKGYSFYFHPADWSYINMPYKRNDVNSILNAFKNMEVDNHIALLTCRQKDNHTIASLGSIIRLSEETDFKFSETVCMTYDGTTKRNGAHLTQISEPGYIFIKGNQNINYDGTTWYSSRFANATNHWDISRHEHKCTKTKTTIIEPDKTIKYGMFSWDVALLMCSLSLPRMHTAFLYNGNPNDSSLLSFIKTFGYKCYCYWNDNNDAEEAIIRYEQREITE